MSNVVDYDGAWKEALEKYLEPFLTLCFPKVAAGIDWSKPVDFLEQELREVVRDAEVGGQRVDKLVKIHGRDGCKEWVLVHIEVQAQRDSDLAGRMYQYYHRLGDRFGVPVTSLAVLADTQPNWRPGSYEQESWGCRLRFEFPSCKLIDLASEPGQLEKDDSPAAVVIAAHLAAQQTARNMGRRHRLKWSLTRRLYERGYEKRDVLELFRLIDWLLVLPEKRAVEFRRELRQYEEEKRMPYVTSIERLGREEGRQKGREEGREEGRQEGLVEGRQTALRESVLDLLEVRFGAVGSPVREKVNSMNDEAALKRLLHEAALSRSMDAFLSRLDRA